MSETDEPPLREILGTTKDKHHLVCGHELPFAQPVLARRCPDCGGDVWSETIEDLGENIEDEQSAA
jgi:hypothetical protein